MKNNLLSLNQDTCIKKKIYSSAEILTIFLSCYLKFRLYFEKWQWGLHLANLLPFLFIYEPLTSWIWLLHAVRLHLKNYSKKNIESLIGSQSYFSAHFMWSGMENRCCYINLLSIAYMGNRADIYVAESWLHPLFRCNWSRNTSWLTITRCSSLIYTAREWKL